MAKKYCKYCYYKDLGTLWQGGEKPLWQWKGNILEHHFDMKLYVGTNGVLYMSDSIDYPGVDGIKINFCPVCGRELDHEDDQEVEQDG